MKPWIWIALLVSLLLPAPAPAQSGNPAPQLAITRLEIYAVNGQFFRRYRFDVTNKAQFPAAMFAPAPNLPPCGANTNSSRTWVDFYEGGGRRIYGFCALNGPDKLDQIWFALPVDQLPPPSVTIVMSDRATNRTYRSNPVSLTGEALMARAEAFPVTGWRDALLFADLALQVRFPGDAPVERSWFARFRRFVARGNLL